MNKFYYDDGMIHVNNYEFSLDSLVELLDMISDLKDTEIVDVDVDGDDVICTFADGEKQTAHCHPEDYDNWSLETGISVCLGKYLTGGSSEYNRIVRHGLKIFKDKIVAEANELRERKEKERIRENKRRKHERYLKRRAERQAAECSNCDEREFCEDRKDKEQDETTTLFELFERILKDLGVEFEILKV